MTRADFVRKFWPLAAAIGQEFNLSPVAIIAHALHESGANNPRAAKRHNYFGFLKAGKHLVYASDEAGFRAYAKRLTTKFVRAATESHNGEAFAQALAFSSYVNEAADKKAVYAKRLSSIYRSVAQDVKRLGLDRPLLAQNAQPGDTNVF